MGVKMTRDTLFIKQDFIMHSGDVGHWKIECDALTDKDIETLAFIIQQNITSGIRRVYGVPRGGMRLAKALEKYKDPNGNVKLIVDDVLTTGNSMEEAKEQLGWINAVGVVIFARNVCPDWIYAVFQMQHFRI